MANKKTHQQEMVQVADRSESASPFWKSRSTSQQHASPKPYDASSVVGASYSHADILNTSARTPSRSGSNAGQNRAQPSLAHLEGKKTSSPNRPYNNILSHSTRGWGYGNDAADEDDDDELFYDDDEDEFGLPSIASMRKKGKNTRRTQSTFITTNAMSGNSSLGVDLDTSSRPRANSSDIAEERGVSLYPSAKKTEGKILRPQYKDILKDPANSLNLINHSAPPSDATLSQREAHSARISRINKFKRILQASTVSLSELRSLAWSGVPDEVRAMTWQLLLGYLPTNSERRVSTLERKRKEYLDGVRQAFERVSVSGGPGSTNTSSGRGRGLDEAVWHQISIDVPRTSPHLQLYSYEATQRSLERILYVWAIRHPASGYVQGINDLVTPFWQVFLGAYMTDINVEEGMDPGQLPRSVLDAVEADSFWCLTKLLDGIQDNYIYAQPDLGPAREGPTPEQIQEALAKRAQQLGAPTPTAYNTSREKGGKGKEQEAEQEEDDERFQDPDNEVGLFAYGAYDREDDEADLIYQEVDEKMDRRRKARREAREQKEREEYERNNPKISQQFADLKRSLATVSDEDWANIPEVGDLTGKNRRARQNLRQRFYAVPDSVIAGARDATQFDTTIADDGTQTEISGAAGGDGALTNFADIGAARDKVLQVRLDQAALGSSAEAASGSATSIDPKGYLTSLTKSELKAGEMEIGDIKRVRVLMESVTRTNPKHAPGWIAIARLEELAGKIVAARNYIAKGCELCPKSEDAWLENIRLNENHNAKIIAANAIKHNDRSTRLWIEAMKLETDVRAKKNVLRQALLHIPQSVAIWKEAVNLEEDPADARLLLAKATEMIPLSVELWLALARLETPENAQKVLNAARKAVPTSHEIWIAAARLQEQMGTANKVNVMKRAVQALVRENAMPKREEWITEAETCEEEGAVLTCGAIIRETLGYGLDEDDDRRDIWMEDAKASIARGKYETARAIYAYALRVFVTSKTLWLAAADLERNHGTKEALWQVLEKAVEACPQSEVLWMQLAKEKWQAGDIDNARLVLKRAFARNPNNEDIWLAASVAFERQLGNMDEALDLVNQGLQIYPKADKLWMMKGQIYESQKKYPQAREAYGTGTRACPQSVPLWLLASRLEEKAGVVVKARSILDRARLAVPKNAELWTESVRVERRANNISQAKVLMAKALQEAPNSGLLWAESIWHLEPRTHRKPRSLEAIKKVENDPILFVTVARIFWDERRLEKAMTWFEKAILADSDQGDSWAWYYKFLIQHGTEEKRQDVISKCVISEPKHGEIWQSVAKDPVNFHKSTEEILKLVVEQLPR
ncbi:U4/U6 x U5 tri-snRNP complex subunit [Talaromyces pinophilus]|uniref:U4/U6 x U5 tri-snRNP complex subunit n=1 Tax=Talaromyces pinophilus TaxID=128442 RepID=A0A6V8H4E1_TALPI|nr:U4/U6 x U5 tri-snRNP complex subunit [Talaromyces pinophilus]